MPKSREILTSISHNVLQKNWNFFLWWAKSVVWKYGKYEKWDCSILGILAENRYVKLVWLLLGMLAENWKIGLVNVGNFSKKYVKLVCLTLGIFEK